tara:strand:+ start:3570 stop:3722 length:153 start_codon:yes stop_codon:yes gene_type:complete
MTLKLLSMCMILFLAGFLAGCNISFCISPSLIKTDTIIEEDSLEKVAVTE